MRKLIYAIGVLLAGCNLAPQYERPAAPVPQEFPSGAAYRPATQPAVAASDLPWQDFFTDERMRQVIGLALENNRDLRLAALNVERARELHGIRRSDRFPAIDANGTAAKRRLPPDLSGSGKRSTVDQYSVDLGFTNWELDFFGRIHNLESAALQQFFASAEARRAAQILLVSEVASTYLALAADRENLKLARTTLTAQQGVLEIVKKRFERGAVPELDVHRAQTQVDTARADAARFTQFVAQDENALNLLAGTTVPGEILPADLGQVKPTMDLAPGTRSDVLLDRPDILQAEHLLRAANADVGAARAALFPRISLTAAIGTGSTELSGLFKSGSEVWSYGGNVALPVLDGRIWGAARLSETDRRIATAQYERAIQAAFREVADALAVHGTVDEQLSAQESLVRAVGETYRLSDVRYTKGLDSYLSVLDAQRSLYAAQQQLVMLRLAKFTNQIALYAVLGGGWQPGSRE